MTTSVRAGPSGAPPCVGLGLVIRKRRGAEEHHPAAGANVARIWPGKLLSSKPRSLERRFRVGKLFPQSKRSVSTPKESSILSGHSGISEKIRLQDHLRNGARAQPDERERPQGAPAFSRVTRVFTRQRALGRTHVRPHEMAGVAMRDAAEGIPDAPASAPRRGPPAPPRSRLAIGPEAEASTSAMVSRRAGLLRLIHASRSPSGRTGPGRCPVGWASSGRTPTPLVYSGRKNSGISR